MPHAMRGASRSAGCVAFVCLLSAFGAENVYQAPSPEPTPEETLILEFANRFRANPAEEAERIIRGICDGGIATVTDSENNQESIKGICDIEGDLELADITAVCNNVLRKPEEK